MKYPRAMRLLAVVLVLAGLIPAGTALAHVGDPENVELFSGTEGPYTMRVLAVPYVGYLHVTVLFEPGSTDPLPYEPSVRVSGTPEGGGGEMLGPATAAREPLSTAHEYATALDAQEEGPWMVSVEISSEAGEAALELPVTLEQPGGVPLSAILTGVGLLLPVLWLIGTAVRDRRSGKRGGRQRRKQGQGLREAKS